MPSEDKHPLLIEIIGGVITGIILILITALIPDVRSFLVTLIKAFASLLLSLWNYLISKAEVSWIIIWLLIFLSVPTVWRYLIRPLTIRNKNNPDGPSLSDYKGDQFNGVNWKWSQLEKSMPKNPEGFCPICSTRLVYHYDGWPMIQTVFTCDHCERDVTTMNGDLNGALGIVKREIERRINTGEWKQSFKSGEYE
jgi:hypothetical protein